MARLYHSFADFEREEIRPGLRIGWSVEELDESMGEQPDFDSDPIEAMWDLQAEEDEDE